MVMNRQAVELLSGCTPQTAAEKAPNLAEGKIEGARSGVCCPSFCPGIMQTPATGSILNTTSMYVNAGDPTF
jgi:hypothetical protein